jgi:hypothetical protein
MMISTKDVVYRSESHYQGSRIEQRRARWWWDLPRAVLMGAALFCASFFIFLHVGLAFNLFNIVSVPESLHSFLALMWIVMPVLCLLPVVLVFHFALMLRVLLWTSNSITREKGSGTWDLLLLSGIPARRIILNKWWATVQRALPAYLHLMWLRLGVIAWVGAWLVVNVNPSAFNGIYVTIQPETQQLLPTWWGLLLAAGVMVIFTFANLAFTAAIGTGVSFLSQNGAFNVIIAFGLRTIVLLAFPLSMFLAGWLGFWNASSFDYENQLAYNIYFASAATATTMVDNSMVATGGTAVFFSEGVLNNFDNDTNTSTSFMFVFSAGGWVMLWYGICGVLALAFACRQASRNGALTQNELRLAASRDRARASRTLAMPTADEIINPTDAPNAPPKAPPSAPSQS